MRNECDNYRYFCQIFFVFIKKMIKIFTNFGDEDHDD